MQERRQPQFEAFNQFFLENYCAWGRKPIRSCSARGNDLVVFNEIIIETSTLRYPTPALVTISFSSSISAI
ncbi:MAG: hypothetical protein E6920_20060 [Clostridium sp.]|nr:hypothetical protein [Clostridium sp.]